MDLVWLERVFDVSPSAACSIQCGCCHSAYNFSYLLGSSTSYRGQGCFYLYLEVYKLRYVAPTARRGALLPSSNLCKMETTSPTLTLAHFIHPLTGNRKSHSALPSATADPPPRLAHLDRESAIALGILFVLILLAIGWSAHTRIKHRRARRDLEELQSDPRMGMLHTRIFRVDRKDSRRQLDGWPGRYTEEGMHGHRRSSVATLPRYESRRASVARRMSQTEKDRRWWGSVAAHGSTAQADRDEHELPPLPPSPALSSLSYDDRASRTAERAASRASIYRNARECSIVGHDWMPFPSDHVRDLQRPDRIEGFRGISWEDGGVGGVLDNCTLPSERRYSVAVEPGEPASISHDWAAGKV
jgi:hypothetical protein